MFDIRLTAWGTASTALAPPQPPQLIVTSPSEQSIGRASDRRGEDFTSLMGQGGASMTGPKHRPRLLHQSKPPPALDATSLLTPPLTPPTNVCLLCKKAEAENRKDHFCSRECIDAAAEAAPMLLHIPTGNESFQTGELLNIAVSNHGAHWHALQWRCNFAKPGNTHTRGFQKSCMYTKLWVRRRMLKRIGGTGRYQRSLLFILIFTTLDLIGLLLNPEENSR